MNTKLSHNKKRNGGLAYEFLVRQLASFLLSRDPRGAARACKIIREHFSPGTPLARERELFTAIVSTRGVSENLARRILAEVAERAREQDQEALDRQKSSLIREVHVSFGRDFFDRHRVPEYRLLASIQLFIDGAKGAKRISESVQKLKVEESLVRWMQDNTSVQREFSADKEVDSVVCSLATARFEEKYSREFMAQQKSLLECYSRAHLTGDMDSVARRLLEDKKKILATLTDSAGCPEIKGDKVTAERFSEARRRLTEMNVSRVTDETIEEMLLYWSLVREVSSDE